MYFLCKHPLSADASVSSCFQTRGAQELIEEYEKKHGGDDKEAGGSKRKGGGDSGEPKSKSAKKPDTR